MVADFIRGGASRLYSLTGYEKLPQMIAQVNSKGIELGMDKLRALFFLILNVDMPLKEYICSPGDKNLYAIALAVKPDETLEKRHSYSMVGTKPMSKEKARRFMLELRDLVNAWLSNEALTCYDLVSKIKEEYLVS